MNYEKDGVEVIKGVFTPFEMQKLKEEAYNVLKDPSSITLAGYKHRPLEMSGSHPGLVFFPALVSPYLNELREDERLQNIVKAKLGPNVRQLNNQIYFREAGDTDEFAWHQDIIFRTPRNHYQGIESKYLQTIIVVDKIRKENGGIQFFPGSHKLGELSLLQGRNLRRFSQETPHEALEGITPVVYEADPGDVLIWSVLTVHGSSANVSNRNRMVYMNGFASADTVGYWPMYLEDGKKVTLNSSLIP